MTKKRLIVVAAACFALLLLLFGGLVAAGFRVGWKVRETAKGIRTATELETIKVALVAYHADYGKYPTGTADEMLLTLEGDNTRGENPRLLKYVMLPTHRTGRPADGWRQPYHLAAYPPGTRPVIFSSGPNRVVDTGKAGADDVYPVP